MSSTTTHDGNKNNATINSNNVFAGSKVRGRPRRPSINTNQTTSSSSNNTLNISCTWCGEGKTPLKYVLPTQNGKKEFCSETCIAEFRKAYCKGACIVCDNVIRKNAPNREYCSTFCMNKQQKKLRNLTQSPLNTTTSGGSGSSRNNGNGGINNNNIGDIHTSNSNSNDSSMSSSSPSGPFQYESFHVFNWENYLKVS